jgi:hypothetical protein
LGKAEAADREDDMTSTEKLTLHENGHAAEFQAAAAKEGKG